MIYLDTSALVKLIRSETESDQLGDWLDDHTEIPWITSSLTEIELPRAIRLAAPEGLPAVPSVLARLDRFEGGQLGRARQVVNLFKPRTRNSTVYKGSSQV